MSHAPLCCPYLWDFSKLCLSVEIKYCQRSSATERQDTERRKNIIDLGHLDWQDCREENHISNGVEMAEDWQGGSGAIEQGVAGLKGAFWLDERGMHVDNDKDTRKLSRAIQEHGSHKTIYFYSEFLVKGCNIVCIFFFRRANSC